MPFGSLEIPPPQLPRGSKQPTPEDGKASVAWVIAFALLVLASLLSDFVPYPLP